MNKLVNDPEGLDGMLNSFWQTFPPIWHATRSLTQQTATEEFGITAAQFHTLRRIAAGGASVSGLAECMHLSRPSISRTVDDLVKNGLVDRRRGAHDRRNVELTLTDEGIELVRNLHKSIGEKMKVRFRQLDSSEMKIVQAGLAALQKIFGNQEGHHQPS